MVCDSKEYVFHYLFFIIKMIPLCYTGCGIYYLESIRPVFLSELCYFKTFCSHIFAFNNKVKNTTSINCNNF